MKSIRLKIKEQRAKTFGDPRSLMNFWRTCSDLSEACSDLSEDLNSICQVFRSFGRPQDDNIDNGCRVVVKRDVAYYRVCSTKIGGLTGFLIFTFAFLLFNSCAKDKVDFTYDNSPMSYEESTVRLINIAGYTQLVANGDSLTNFSSRGNGTVYFPKNGNIGGKWTVPDQLFVNGRLDLELLGIGDYQVNFSIQRPNRQSVDYYTVHPEGSGQPYVVPVERDTTPPSRSDYFKIRILNLTKTVNPLTLSSYTGGLEDLVGSVTLTYADGTPVNTTTSNISIGQRVSDYIELPYGSYQFKVLTADGRQFAATNIDGLIPNEHGSTNNRLTPLSPIIDPPTSRMHYDPHVIEVSHLTYQPIHTYQPGGVYTVVVAPSPFRYWSPNANTPVSVIQNGFSVIEDNSGRGNSTFGKIQFINGTSSTALSARVSGNVVNGIAFGESSEYQILTAGSHRIEISGTGLTTLVDSTFHIEANKNYSAWIYDDKDGIKRLLIVSNDLSGQVYVDRFADNGVTNLFNYRMVFGTRFLNLNPDIPYLSFTIDQGQHYSSNPWLALWTDYQYNVEEAMYNLQPGKVTERFPYIYWSYFPNDNFQFRAYRSSPDIAPGTWASDIPVRHSSELVVNPLLYEQAGRQIPSHEPGIYSIALIGRTGDSVPDSQKARVTIVKHNK